MAEHQWVTKLGRYTVDHHAIKRSLACFRNYQQVGALQRKVVEFIVSNLLSNSEQDPYLKIFYVINATADGMCTKDQFIHAFWSLGFTEVSVQELDKLLAYIDDDRNGYVTFDEFLRASVSAEDIMTPQKLLEAFKTFDEDGSGSISMQEFKSTVDPN